MAFHRFAIIDGQRIDVSRIDTVDERSCDIDGKFVHDPIVFSGNLFLPGQPPRAVNFDLCPEHYRATLPRLAEQYPVSDDAR